MKDVFLSVLLLGGAIAVVLMAANVLQISQQRVHTEHDLGVWPEHAPTSPPAAVRNVGSVGAT
jgi:hypothetical protein